MNHSRFLLRVSSRGLYLVVSSLALADSVCIVSFSAVALLVAKRLEKLQCDFPWRGMGDEVLVSFGGVEIVRSPWKKRYLGIGKMTLEFSVRNGELYNEGGGSKYGMIFFLGWVGGLKEHSTVS